MPSKKLALLAPTLGLLSMSACGFNRPPVATASSPPLADLTCPAEPDVVKMLVADPSGLAFDVAVREAGEGCRSALLRVCRWHQERGAKVTCSSDRPKP